MSHPNNIEAIERRLWSSADNLRANSNYASNEYFLPVMGLIFLRHAYNRYLRVRAEIVKTLPTRGGAPRPLAREDFSGKGAIYLREHAQFDALVALPDSADRAEAIVQAMESIEADYATLNGILPKSKYQELDNDVLGQLLRTFDDAALKTATGDVFGRIYEYFLTQFADQKAHDGGEFFTPVALVQMIVNVIEPDHGRVLDPACGSGGMFVQSAHFIERAPGETGGRQNPTERVTFYGMEKNLTTIRLSKMNLAVHGLEGDIQQAITYYEDPHELCGRADFVMANPPFNVDEVDADKIKNDPRLPFGLPGVNKKGKVSNGNYLWISYFYSYLNATGRAGFVMSSQASSAGRDEAKVRQKLIESGAVDVMIAIRSNFFYTRTVPCELWFLDRNKPAARQDTALMLDARAIYRQVTRKIYDFSPEQRRNLTAIVWLYRGQPERFLALAAEYLAETHAALDETPPVLHVLTAAARAVDDGVGVVETPRRGVSTMTDPATDWPAAWATWQSATADFAPPPPFDAPHDIAALHAAAEALAPALAHVQALLKAAHALPRAAAGLPDSREMNAARKELDAARETVTALLKDRARYFYRQAHWLLERFPEATLRDVPGLVKVVTRAELAANDWSLTPGRYVGVAPEEVDEDFDFGETLQAIHAELAELNGQAAELAAQIATNFEELDV